MMTPTSNSYVAMSAASSPVQGIISQQMPANVMSSPGGMQVAPGGQMVTHGNQGIQIRVPNNSVAMGGVPTTVSMETKVLDKRRLEELVKEVDPLEQLDDDVEEVLMQIADDFIESVVTSSCKIAKHRKSSTLEAKDVQLHLECNWGMWLPGFGTDELRPYKKASTTEAHKQRMALIRKTLKKT